MSGNNIQLVELLRLIEWQRAEPTADQVAAGFTIGDPIKSECTVELTVTIKLEFFHALARRALRNKHGKATLAHGNIVAKAVRR